MEPMVGGLNLDRGWIKGIQSEAIDCWIHLTRGLVCMGILLVPHLEDIIIITTIIILTGGAITLLRSSRISSLLHLMER